MLATGIVDGKCGRIADKWLRVFGITVKRVGAANG